MKTNIKYYELVSPCNKKGKEEVVASFLDLERAKIRYTEANNGIYKKKFLTGKEPYLIREMEMEYEMDARGLK